MTSKEDFKLMHVLSETERQHFCFHGLHCVRYRLSLWYCWGAVQPHTAAPDFSVSGKRRVRCIIWLNRSSVQLKNTLKVVEIFGCISWYCCVLLSWISFSSFTCDSNACSSLPLWHHLCHHLHFCLLLPWAGDVTANGSKGPRGSSAVSP